MTITLHRKYCKEAYTIGKLYIDGQYFCDACEDTDRGLDQSMEVPEILKRKKKNETAIPTGVYTVRFTYSPRFKRLMPQIENVKGFSGVRIHAGNTAKDTEGCILLGRNTIKGGVTQSRAWVTKFETALKVAGGVATLTITK